MRRTVQNGCDEGFVPKLNLSVSPVERARLERLSQMRGGAKLSRVVADAVIHTMASIELHEQVHYVVPSERDKAEEELAGEEG